MTKLFISYRREDSQHAAGRLYLALCTGHMSSRDLFLDIYDIPGGVDFTEDYEASIAKSDVVLALIGSKWAEAGRLDDPQNHVRRELLAARKHSVPILPLLLDETQMPKAATLPDELRFICNLSAESITHIKFDDDAVRLLRTAKGLADKKSHSAPLPPMLEEQLNRELENARNARRSRDLTKLPPAVRLVVEHAQIAETKAIEAQYKARGAAELAKVAARRARGGEAGTQDRSIDIKGGGKAHWSGEGTWDHRNGYGEYSVPTEEGGHHSYRGGWKDNREAGFGVIVQSNPDGGNWRAEGEMAAGNRQGFGVYVTSSGDTRLGEFRDGLLEGPGIYCWANGTRFEGEWRAGKKRGFGVQWSGDGSTVMAGKWDGDDFQKV